MCTVHTHKEEFGVNNVRASYKFKKIEFCDLPNEADDLMYSIRSIDFTKIYNNLTHFSKSMSIKIGHRLRNIKQKGGGFARSC